MQGPRRMRLGGTTRTGSGCPWLARTGQDTRSGRSSHWLRYLSRRGVRIRGTSEASSATLGSQDQPLEPARAENSVHGSDQQGCSPSRPAVMITDHVPAVYLPPDHAGGFMAAPIPACGDVEDRRDLDPAPPARGPAAAAAASPEPELGGPGPARGPARRNTQSAPPRDVAAGRPRHDPALAPRPRPPPLGGAVQALQDRPPSHPPEHQGPGSPAGPAETPNGATGGSTASWPAWE